MLFRWLFLIEAFIRQLKLLPFRYGKGLMFAIWRYRSGVTSTDRLQYKLLITTTLVCSNLVTKAHCC